MTNIVPYKSFQQKRKRKIASQRDRLALRMWHWMLLWALTSPILEQLWKPVLILLGSIIMYLILDAHDERIGETVSVVIGVFAGLYIIKVLLDHLNDCLSLISDEPPRYEGPPTAA